jgi:class 3 adenylate cyclase
MVHVRIGIASGPVVAGVIGSKKFFYDVWGDTVNIASQMESTGEAGRIQVAPSTGALLRQNFDLLPRGTVEIRGKGNMETSFLEPFTAWRRTARHGSIISVASRSTTRTLEFNRHSRQPAHDQIRPASESEARNE